MESNEVSNRALVLLYPGCTIAEVVELATRLVNADIRVQYAAIDSSTIADRSGLQIQPDKAIDDLDLAGVAIVIVPGGDPEAVIDNPKVTALLKAAAHEGSLIAGICAGVLVLASAGLLDGRSITHNYRSPWAPAEISTFVERFWDGAIVQPDPTVGVVVDGRIITALPNATIEFATTVCCQLGLYTAEQAELIGRHLRGEHVIELHDHLKTTTTNNDVDAHEANHHDQIASQKP